MKCIEDLLDPEDEEILAYVKSVELDEKQEISLSIFKDVKFKKPFKDV